MKRTEKLSGVEPRPEDQLTRAEIKDLEKEAFAKMEARTKELKRPRK